MTALRRACVFSGSSPGARPAYREMARELGTSLARAGLGLVYGGAKVGLMGALADAALAAGGEVIGVIPQALMDKELAHPGLTQLRVVSSMHQRKQEMAELSDAFVALPGGMGTLEELAEVLTWAQLGIHAKPCGLLNVEGYYDPLTRFFDHAVTERFITPQHRAMLVVADTPDDLLRAFAAYAAPTVKKWVDLDQT